MSGHAGAYEVIEGRGILVEWHMGNGDRLSLIANPGGEDIPEAPRPPDGREIFATDDEVASAMKEGVWPAWSAMWVIDGPAAGTGH
jgi:hypothetical protein